MRIRLLNDTTAVGSKANTGKFDMIVVIVIQCSTINQIANDDGSALATIVLIAGAVLTPVYWTKVLPMSQTA